ncbi:hypothetical protein THAOC_02404, partial [Thalassiosira oceanica]
MYCAPLASRPATTSFVVAVPATDGRFGGSRESDEWLSHKSGRNYDIVADFVARDFPVPTQASNDSGLGARTDVLGEVKTLQPSKTSYEKGNCQTNRPVNLRATQAMRSYRRRAAGLDQK